MKHILDNKIFTYPDVQELIADHLNKIENLHDFCKKHDFNYNTLLLVKNKYKKQYPKIAIKLLQIFGYNVEAFTAFKFFTKINTK